MDISMVYASFILPAAGILIFFILLTISLKKTYGRRLYRDFVEWKEWKSGKKHWTQRNKYVEADVFRWRGTFFGVGLVFATGLALLALNWTRYQDEDYEWENPWQSYELLNGKPLIAVKRPSPRFIKEIPNDEMRRKDSEALHSSIDQENSMASPPIVEKAPPPPPPPPPPPEPGIEGIFRVVEHMPRFPGCEDQGRSAADKKQCADKKLLEFIYKNLKYPAIARKNGVEGTVVIAFIVEKNGDVSSARIVRDIGAGCGEEALRIVNLMNKQGLKWVHGDDRGRAVRVQFNLPVKFRLER